jgi:glycerol kinase
MKPYVIGLDQGTTGSLACLMNRDGEIVRSAYQAHPPTYPQPGWVEQDPDELWRVARDLLNRVMIEASVRADEIAGIGLDNQGESVVLWDRRTGEALSPVLVWQDTRTQAAVDALAANPDTANEVRRRTGLKLDSYFSATKMRWLLDHASIPVEHLAIGTLDSWLIWKLTEGRSFVTDGSTASRTLLFNLHTLAWDDWLLNLFGIPAQVLPEIRKTTGEFGCVTHPDVLCRGVPIVASIVDQPAAMIGQGCLNTGQIKATYGTGCFINLNAGPKPLSSKHGLLTILTWQRDGQPTYGLEGGVFTAGATLNWLRDQIGFVDDTRQIDKLCAGLSDSGGAMWIPAQLGLGAPYWNRTMRGAWLGIDLATTKAHLTRAVLEGIAAQVAQIVDAMQDDAGLTIDALRVDGGLTGSSTLMQIQANLLGKPVEVLANPEATASGTCALTARAAGLWADDDRIRQQVRVARTFTPAISEDERQAYLKRFDSAIRHLEAWNE